MRDKLQYQPALDGLRAISIALVLVFHLGATWMPGGYLGVSVFFTLSGFLITSLLLGERLSTGRVDVRAFYVRRLRRLLPASLLCLGGIAVLAGAGVIAERSDLRAGVLGAALQVANWVSLLGSRSYADLFVAPSPVDHFWSLAIEEQFYWLWPLAIAALTTFAARRADSRRTISIVLVGTFLALSIGAVVTARTLGGDVAYFASWARFAEIIAGAALAALVSGRRVAPRVAHLALPCLMAIAVLSVVTPSGRGWAYGGGLPVFALLTVGLIVGVQVEGPVRSLLSLGPLPAIGRVSYGLYLFHWPVFTILDADRVHQAGLTLAVTRLAVTAAITVASYHLLERPIRMKRVLAEPRHYVFGAAAGCATLVAAIAVLVPTLEVETRTAEPVVIRAALAADSDPADSDPAGSTPAPVAPVGRVAHTPAPAAAAAAGAPDLPAAPTTVVPATAVAPSTVVGLFGDSIADWLLHDATPTFARADVTLVDAAIEGCDGAIDAPVARHRSGAIMTPPDECRPWDVTYPRAAEQSGVSIDVAVLMVGNAPVVDHEVNGAWISPCVDMRWYLDDLEQRVEYLRDHVGDVVLALPAWGGHNATFLNPDDHVARTTCIREQLRTAASSLGIGTVDLAENLCPAGPAGACTEARWKDGVHVDAEDAPQVLDWLLDEVVTRNH